jgi:hypothetical protein
MGGTSRTHTCPKHAKSMKSTQVLAVLASAAGLSSGEAVSQHESVSLRATVEAAGTPRYQLRYLCFGRDSCPSNAPYLIQPGNAQWLPLCGTVKTSCGAPVLNAQNNCFELNCGGYYYSAAYDCSNMMSCGL